MLGYLAKILSSQYLNKWNCIFDVNTVNPEILARILFSRIALKDMLAALKFATTA